jgi:translation initiation factor 2 beta subunit (eIF-2beta)/eIF-5
MNLADFPEDQELLEMSKEQLEKQKVLLIERFMQIQEVLDRYNEEKYHLCCWIQKINLALDRRKKLVGQKRAQEHLPRQPRAQTSSSGC